MWLIARMPLLTPTVTRRFLASPIIRRWIPSDMPVPKHRRVKLVFASSYYGYCCVKDGPFLAFFSQFSGLFRPSRCIRGAQLTSRFGRRKLFPTKDLGHFRQSIQAHPYRRGGELCEGCR